MADIFNQDNDEEDDHKPKKKLKSTILPPVLAENKKARTYYLTISFILFFLQHQHVKDSDFLS